MHDQLINQFLAEIIKEAGLSDLPADFKDGYLAQLRQELEFRLSRATALALPEDSLDEFADLSSQVQTTPEQMLDFFQNHIDNYPQFLQGQLEKFKSDFLSQAQELEKLQTKNK